MNELDKINAVINEIGNVYNLTPEQTNLIKDNIIKRSELYKNIQPNINPHETTFINNTSTITDVFLNRLINNIRVYDFRNTYDMSVKEKGTYAANSQTILLEGDKFLHDVTEKRLNDKIQNTSEELLKKSTLKVKNHEFGHALQVSFTGTNGMFNDKMIQVVNNLNIKYPEVFKKYNNLSKEPLKSIHSGMTQHAPSKVESEEEKARNYYANYSRANDGEHYIDEIFNDEEAMKVTEINNHQFEYKYADGSKKNIYNYESSNYRITSYARMMKLLMGKTRTYKSMYEDSFETYKFFDQFINISSSIYSKDKPPMVNIMNSLIKIKQNNDVEEMKKLDLFFTKCLQLKVNHSLKDPDFSMNNLNNIVNIIKDFKTQMMTNDQKMLESNNIIQDIQHKVDEKYKEIKNHNQQSTNVQNNHQNDKIEEKHENIIKESIKSDLSKKTEEQTNNDEKKDTETLYNNLIKIIKNNCNKTLSPEEKKQVIGEMFYYEGYFVKSLTIETWTPYFQRLVTDLGDTKLEEYMINVIVNNVRDKFKINEKKDSTKVNDFSELKNKINKIKKRYKEMLSDRYIDDDELQELITKLKELNNIAKDKRSQVTNNKEKIILDEIIIDINNNQNKMNNYLNKIYDSVRNFGR